MSSLIHTDQGLCERTWYLADAMMKAADQHAYVAIKRVTTRSGYPQNIGISENWAGGNPNKPESRAPHYGPAKAGELVARIDPKIQCELTPIPWYKDSTGLRGGVRTSYGTDFENKLHNIVAVSGYAADRIDLKIALVLNLAMAFETQFHHVGFSHRTKEEAEKAAYHDRHQILNARDGIVFEDDGIYRIYIPVYTSHPGCPNGVYWRLHQYEPLYKSAEGTYTWWNMATMSPESHFSWICDRLEQDQTDGEITSIHEPTGVVWETNTNGNSYGISMRNSWWDPATAK